MNSGKGVTQTLAEFAASVTFDDLPQEVIHQGKRHICDSIACTLGGYSSETGRIVRDFVKTLGGNEEATIIGSGEKNSVTNAAFVNANMGNAMDSDDTILGSHPAVPTIMSAMPIAEKERVSGKDFITAVVVGYDIAIRVGGASESWFKIEGGKLRNLLISGSSWYILGAAIAAAKVLGLDNKRMIHVLGLAGTFAPLPFMAHWAKPVDSLPLSKYHEVGWTAQGGLSAALLAQRGYTGPTEILEGSTGFWRMQGREECNFDFMINKLGQRWWIMEASLKPWPCCRLIHHCLTAFTRIINEHDIKAEEIERVMVKGSLMYHPIFHVRHPQTPVNMQFSAAHSLANAAFRVASGPKWQYPESINDPKMKEFRDKVTIELDPKTLEVAAQDLAGDLPKQLRRVPTTVEVMALGKTYQESVEYAKGDPPVWVEGMAMTDEELKNKFREHALDVLSTSAGWREKTEKAIDITYNLEKVDDITELIGLLSP